MRCAMCGYVFEQSELVCQGACPLGAHCMVVCCPRCGYSTVDPARSTFTRRLLRLFRRADEKLTDLTPVEGSGTVTAPAEVTLRLLDLKLGQTGHISEAESRARAEVGSMDAGLAQLSHYGLLPGTPLRLIQKRPVPIVQVGQTELALDHSLAAEIFVDVLNQVG